MLEFLETDTRENSAYKKNTATFKAAGLFEDTRPVTQARHMDMPAALSIIKDLLPNLSTVNEQMIPPKMIQA